MGSIVKAKRGLRRVGAVAAVLLVSVAVVAWWLFKPCVKEEFTRTASPDGRYDAVVARLHCGASPYTYFVYVVPAGRAIGDREHVVFNGSQTDDLRPVWRSNQELHVAFTTGITIRRDDEWIDQGSGSTISITADHERPASPTH